MTAVTEVPHVAGTVGEVGWGSSATELVLGRELLWAIIPVKWLVSPHLEAMDFGHLEGEQSDLGDLR